VAGNYLAIRASTNVTAGLTGGDDPAMRMTTGIVIVLMSWAVVGTCGVGRAAEPVEDLRLVASAPTHLQVNWQGRAAAYRIVYSQAIESRQHTTSVVAQGAIVPSTCSRALRVA